MAPEPFEIISEDGTKVFVFTPAEDGVSSANAAVYEIVDNERQLIYEVEDLSSFAFESNFFFSADMMHFARVFPPYGMDTFEVFSNGIRTRVVTRDDFIENYASVESESSIGPFYTVTWQIKEDLHQNNTIVISTDENDAILFDLATARFESENAVPSHIETPVGADIVPLAASGNQPESVQTPQTQSPLAQIFIVTGVAVALIAVVVFL
jgi:hypothetical protein